MNPQTPINQQEKSGGVPKTTTVVSAVSKEAASLDPATKISFLTPPPTNASIKRIIRKITPIDAKKLREYGLDRKIAEAVSKQKSLQMLAASSNKPKQTVSNIKKVLPSPQTVAASPATNITGTPPIIACTSIATSSKAISPSPAAQNTAKTSLINKTITPPKITITGPEAPTEMEIKNLEGLNAQQRLAHVKNFLNRKLLQKKTLTKESNVKLYEHARLTSDTSDHPHRKDSMKTTDKIGANSKLFLKLKDVQDATPAKATKMAKTKTPQKSPKDIARKLDFQDETATLSVQQQPKRNYRKSLNSEICNIPKASLKNSSNNQGKQVQQTNFSYNSINSKEVRHHEKQKIDFPEMSPLKIYFPTTNVPKETPLPAIDSFKKPHSLSNAVFYNAQNQMKDCTEYLNTNYGSSPPVLQQSAVLGHDLSTQCSSTNIHENSTASNSTNCLIVLENKVLSQEEMIDLTELRLSTSKVDTPRFATPHKPIPEVVIKQENSDEYSTTLPPLLTDETMQTNIPKETKVTTSLPTTDKVVISTKQNKKIIINAQKLKLPPDQLANLAKQIAQRSGVSKSNISIPIQQNQYCGKSTIGSNLDNANSNTNYAQHVTANQTTTNSFHNVQIHSDPSQNDHNYQSLQYQYNSRPKANPTQNTQTCQKLQPTNRDPNKNEVDNIEINSQHVIVIVKEENKSNDGYNTLQNSAEQCSFTSTCTTNNFKEETVKPNRSSICYRKPAVEIIDEPVETNDCFSAVDFIAAFNETNPITEETSLELSPEELNLNASFATSFSSMFTNSYGNSKIQDHEESMFNKYSPVSSKINDIENVPEKGITALNTQQMSTIVIESSNGPETILSNANNIIMDNTLQNMQNTKASNILNSYESYIDKSNYFIDCNSKQSEILIQPTSITEIENPNNIYDNSQIIIDTMPSKSSDSSIANEYNNEHNNSSISNEIIPLAETKETINKVLESETKLINYNNKTGLEENFNSSIQDLGATAVLPTSVQKDTNTDNKQQLLLEPLAITSVTQELDNAFASSSTNTAIKEPLYKVSTVTDTKRIEESEASKSKSTENNTVVSVNTKRISRFKKGKINLVQRNKTTAAGSNKIMPSKAIEKKSITEDKLISSNENIAETNDIINKHKDSNNLDQITINNIIEEKSQNSYKPAYKAFSEAIQDSGAVQVMHNNNKDITADTHADYIDKLNKNGLNNETNNVSRVTSSNETKDNSTILPNSCEPLKDEATSRFTHNSTNQELEKCVDKNVNNKIVEKCIEGVVLENSTTSISKPPESSLIEAVETENCDKIKSNQEASTYSCSDNITKIEESLTSNVNSENISCKNITNLLEPEVVKKETVLSKNRLENVKQPSVSLTDIVKHTPLKDLEKPPIIPFKTQALDSCQTLTECKGINSLLKNLRTCEKDFQKEQQEGEERSMILNIKNEDMSASKESCINPEVPLSTITKISPCSTANTQSEITTFSVSVNSKNIHSTNQLITDSSLTLQFEGNSKSSENIYPKANDTPLITTRSAAFLGITPPGTPNIVARRTRLYSKPLETELSDFSSPRIKRTRFYSQTLETNKTKVIDSLKHSFDLTESRTITLKNCLTTEESCKESTCDEKSSTTTQRKKLRKTLEDIKKSQNTYSDSDSETDNRDFTCMNDCEEGNEFLGFEEDPINSHKNSKILHKKQDTEKVSITKTKGGTLKNWLTTGKAISPTLTNETQDKKPSIPITLAQRSVPLKKRLDLSANLHEETDITDDTSPADDDEESESRLISKNAKRSLNHVIDSDNNNLLVSKKLKLDKSRVQKQEHIFTEPRQLRVKSKSSCTESDRNDGIQTPDRLNSKHGKDDSKTNLFATNKTSTSETETDSDCYERNKSTRSFKSKHTDSDTEISGNESNGNVDKLKSKKAANSRFKDSSANKDDMKNQSITEIELKKEINDNAKRNSKELSRNSTILINDEMMMTKFHQKKTNSEVQKCKKEPETNSILEKSTSPLKPDIKTSCLKDRKSKRRKTKDDKQGSEIQELTIPNADLNNSAECIKTTSDDIDTSSSFLAKKFRKKKRTLIETEGLSASKKVKLTDEKKPRSPKQIITSTTLDNSNDTTISSLLVPLESQPSLELKTKLPSKRKSKIENSDNVSKAIKIMEPPVSATSVIVKKEISKATPTRGRKPSAISNFNPRLLLITKREQLDTDEVLTETQPGDGSIQCGLCLAHTFPSNWSLHLADHYGVGWKVGEEKLNIEIRSSVLNYINAYIKEYASDGVKCRMCNKTYRSGAGLLLHIETCGMGPIRLTCEFCKRDYAQSSMPIHIRSCHAKFMLENKKNQAGDDNSEENEEIFGNTGRLKRHSTIKAENKLKSIEKELVDNDVGEKTISMFEPKDRIRYVPPLLEKDCKKKWLKEIKSYGKGSCPKKACKFTSEDLKELAKHLSICKYIKSGYYCKPCRKRVFKTEKEAIDHVIKTHQNTNESDYEAKSDNEASSDDEISTDGADISADNESAAEDEELEDEEPDGKTKNTCKNKKIYYRPVNETAGSFLRKRVFDGRYIDINGLVLRKWKSFLKLNYATRPLFAEFCAEFSVKEHQLYLKYLPSNTKSMKFSISNKAILKPSLGEPQANVVWSELNRFESFNNKMETLYYLGAPIKFCSWLPLPNDVDEQYLMVSYRREKFTKFLNPKQHCTVLLIFKVIQNKHVPQLKIHYGFVVKDGPVHNVAFLPSGGYDNATNRLGLVAVATINSSINIYALPINVPNAKTTDTVNDSIENINFIDIKPQFCLCLDTQNANETTDHTLLKTQCLHLCWSEFSGHKHIFASFSNGFIGIWDITNDSEDNLNRYVVDDFINYVPLNYFYLGEKGIKSIVLHYDTQGPRWLAAAGMHRKLVIYDIKNMTQPIIMKDDCAKNIILSMDWCQIWETVIVGYCNTLPNNGRNVTLVNPTNVMFTQNKLDLMAAGVTQVHYSPLVNVCVTSVENGDLLFLDPRELHYEYQLGKQFGERRVLSALDIQQLNGEKIYEIPKNDKKNHDNNTPSNWSMYDESFRDKHGLIFKPFLKIKPNMKNIYLNEKRCPPLNFIPLLRINALRCNLNLNAKHLVALGYENGFLRIIYYNKDT